MPNRFLDAGDDPPRRNRYLESAGNRYLEPEEQEDEGVGGALGFAGQALGTGFHRLAENALKLFTPVPGTTIEGQPYDPSSDPIQGLAEEQGQAAEESREFYGKPTSFLGRALYGLAEDIPTFAAAELAAAPVTAASAVPKAASLGRKVLAGMAHGAEVGVPYSVLSGHAGEPGPITGLPGIVEDPLTFAALSPPFTLAGAGLSRLFGRRAAEAVAPAVEPAVEAPRLPSRPSSYDPLLTPEPGVRDLAGIEQAAMEIHPVGMAEERAPGVLSEDLGRSMTVPEQLQTTRFGAEVPAEATAQPGEYIAPDAEDLLRGVGFPDEAIIAPPTRLGEAGFVNRGAIINWVKRNFATGGNIPKELWSKLLKKDSGINASTQEMVFNIRNLMRGAEEAYGLMARFRLPQEGVDAINAYLRGAADVSVLPPALQAPARNIRNHVDALSQKLIDAGAAEGKLALTIEANKGVYLTRAYQLFENPRWASFAKSHPEMESVRQKVMALLRSQNPDIAAREAAGDPLAKGELQAMFNDLLAKPEEGPIAILARRPGLSKNLSILQRRKEIAPEIRALWGEVDTPLASYARSVQKMSSLLETHKALTGMRDAGLGRFFFTPEMRGMAPEATTLIAGEGSEVLKPLNGLYTYPEIAQSIKDFTVSAPIGSFTQAWVRLNAATKFSKVILSHVALLRNMLGNIGFAVTQGHWRVMKGAQAAKALMAQMNPLGVSGLASRIGFNERKWQEYVLDLQRLGVVGDAARAHELRDIMNEVAKSGHWLDEMGGSLPAKFARKVIRGATEIYRAGDDVWKIFAYENELARYRGALKASGTVMPEDALKQRVAENVRLTYPTYSNVPRAIRGLRRFPVLGPFVSFPWEVYRTTVATIDLAFREMADPSLASVGRARLASAALGIGVGFTGVAAFTKHIVGVTDETENALRRFLPSWSQNSTLAYLNRDEDGNARVIDLSYTDPYSYMRDAITAALRGEDWHAKAVGSAAELLKPFASPEILTAKVYEAIKLWQELPAGVPIAERLERVGNVLYEAFEPGSLNALLRLKEATANPGQPYDQKYDPEVERLVNLTGTRVTEVNPATALVFKARSYADELRKARSEEVRVARRRSPLDDSALLEASGIASTIREKAFADMRADIEAARILGKSDFEIRRSLSAGGLPAAEINALILGLPRLHMPQIQVEPGDPLAPELIRRQLLIQQNQFQQ